jgi:type IV pilus assembly protein PilX
MTISVHGRQRGAVLFVALVMLLVLTLLAVGGMREMQLEGRMTGYRLELQRLTSAAESALREGEGRVSESSRALEACSSSSPCYTGLASSYAADFSGATAYTGLDGATSLPRNARWYLRYIGNSCKGGSGGSANAYLSKGQAGCTYYYEVNAQAYKDSASVSTGCAANTLCLRSSTALVIP